MGVVKLKNIFALPWRSGRLVRSGTVLLAWMLLRATAQAATVVLLARTLGTQAYGEFVATIAVASFVSPLVGLGLSNMVLRNGSRDPLHMRLYFSRAARWWVLSFIPGVIMALAAAAMLLPAGMPKLAMSVAIASELASTSLAELVGRYRQAKHQMSIYGAINAGLPLVRLLVLGMWVAFISQSGAVFVWWIYAAANLGYVLILWPSLFFRTEALDIRPSESMTPTSGLPFSLAAFAMRLQGEFNKPILAQAGFGLAGTFNIAQRAVEVVSLPLQAIQETLWPRLYAHQNPMQQLRRSGSILVIFALVLTVVVWQISPLLPYVFGAGYEGSIEVLRMLAWLPLVQLIRALLNFHLIHHQKIHWIGWASALGVVVSVASTAIFVPIYGMTGAVTTAYATEIIMTIFLLTKIKLLTH